jgi:hypothetical protein
VTATADLTPVMVFAEEIDEGTVIEARCHVRTDLIKDNDGRPTGFASCAYLSRPHVTTSHALIVERLRGASIVCAITRNEDGEQVAWSAARIQPVRTLRA